MNEDWRDVLGFEGAYRINADGCIKSLGRDVFNPIHDSVFIKERILKTHIGVDGYYKVGLCKDGKIKKLRLHRLIALAFIPNPLNKPCINHKNGNKLDNRIENLEWCTRAENNTHSYRTGLRKASLGKRYTGQYKSIVCYDMNGNELALFKSCKIASELMKMDRCSIGRVLNGELSSYKGYKFKYATDANRN